MPKPTTPAKKVAVVATPPTRAKRDRPSSGAQTFPADLTCGICYDVLDDAHQAPCCGQLACRDCLDDATAASETCPFCRAALAPSEGVPDRRVDRQAAALERPCANDGCEFRGNRVSVNSHRAECPHSHVELREEVTTLRRTVQKLLRIAHFSAFRDRLWAEPNSFSPASAFCEIGMHCHAFDGSTKLFDGEPLQDILACMREFAVVAGLPRTELRIEVVNRSVRFTLMRHADEPKAKSWQRVVLVLMHPEELGKSLIRRSMIPPARSKSVTFSNWVTIDELKPYLKQNRLVVAVGLPSSAVCFIK